MISAHVLDYLKEMRRLGVTVRTAGGTNLNLSRKELEAYTLIEHDGAEVLRALESWAWKDAMYAGLIDFRREADGVHFLIPDWQRLLGFLRGVTGGETL